MKLALGILTALSIVAAIGCEGNISTEPTAEVASTGPPPPAPPPPGGTDTTGTDDAEPAAETETTEPAADASPDAAAADATQPAGTEAVTEKAAVGVGVKGKDYGGPGFVTTPIQQYFRTGERIAFEIQIPSNMKLYKAAHDNKGPKTHEEFMDVIIKENGVELPELAAGEEYLYDPKTEQLLVKHPVK